MAFHWHLQQCGPALRVAAQTRRSIPLRGRFERRPDLTVARSRCNKDTPRSLAPVFSLHHFQFTVVSLPSSSSNKTQKGATLHKSGTQGGGAYTRAIVTMTLCPSKSTSRRGSSCSGVRVKRTRVREKRGCPSSSKHPVTSSGRQSPNAASSRAVPATEASLRPGTSKAVRAFPCMFTAMTCPAWTCLIKVL
jgi:hypothetical protein